MRKGTVKFLACLMASAMVGTTVVPTVPPRYVQAAEEQNSTKWEFSGIHGEKTETGISLSGDGDSFGISDISKEDNYSVSAKLTQGDEDGAIGIVLGAKDTKSPNNGSLVLNVTPASGEVRLFKFPFGGTDEQEKKCYDELKNQTEYKFNIKVTDGKITATINDTKVAASTAVDKNLLNGNIGFISFRETMTTSDFKVEDITPEETGDWSFVGNGELTDNGIRLNGKGDNLGISRTINKKDNYSLKADLKTDTSDGAVGVVLGAKDANNPKEGSVVANVNPATGVVRMFCFQGGLAGNLQKDKTVEELKGKEDYKFDVTVENRQLNVKINDVDVFNMKITDTIFEGNIGFICFNKDVTISNIEVKDIEEKNTTVYLTGLEVKGADLNQKFSQDIDSYAAVVENNTESLTFVPTAEGAKEITVNGTAVASGNPAEVKLKEGSQQISIVVTSENGAKDETIINVLRKAKNSVYSVPTRPQYHFSPALAWCNDPNGMVYYKGEYHLFYQYYPDDNIWGPMHWAHAVSKDLIHWEELPIALYYQEDQGAMFSGSCVVDDTNVSGLFGEEKGEGKGGLVAIYTQNNDGRGQDQAIAFSKDNGRTWTKYKGNPILKWNEDPLDDAAFRDPKVFYHKESGKYMMVVAGGILRIYSSENLIDWKVESTYRGDEGNGNPRIETECPDMYSLKDAEGNTKWVISEGGRYYRIGDFKEVNGKWTFVQDDAPSNSKDIVHHVMNFGPQSYAAMTYYIDHQTEESRRIMINWASTWEGGYCNNVSAVTGKWGYNGFFNLQTELNLKNTKDGYRLIQTPIEEYKTLRVEDAKTKIEGTIPKKTETSENLLSGIKAGQYEIVAELAPKAGTEEVGFKLRTNEAGTKETVVKYNVETKKVSINVDKSGTIPSGQRKGDVVSDAIVTEEDGKVKLNIFVDESSVEVYAQDGQQTGAMAIFPATSNTGMEVYSEGGDTDAEITVYPMKSIWEDKLTGDTTATDLYLSTDTGSGQYNVGDTISIEAAISPVTATQEVKWSISGNNDNKVKIEKEGKSEIQLKALKDGVVTVRATSENGLSRSIKVYIDKEERAINLGNWKEVNGDGNWTISKNENSCTGNATGDAFLMSGIKIPSADYIFESDVIYNGGQAFALLFRGQSPDNNKAYAANVDVNRKDSTARIFTFGGGTGDIGDDAKISLTKGQKYHVKVQVKGNLYKVYYDGALVLKVRDSQVDKNYPEGRYVGFNVFNANVTFENMKVTPLEVKVPETDKEIELVAGDKKAIKVTNIDEDSFNAVEYTTSDANIAVVDDEGNVTAKKAGTAVITSTVTTFGRRYTLETKVVVSPKAVTVTLKGNGGKVVTVIKDAKAGAKLPAWDKSKFKAAGKKGYAFAGWVYNGKVVKTMPSSSENIVLTAKFTKLTVGQAKALTVKGKSGTGVGFVATSAKNTKSNGSRRGFRFRYATNSKMKSATYKTTGLAKNVYTKTGLKKNKKYYVQVRYYYYDSTNQKVYGAYSTSKSVKAY